jgi:hypothetical protein
MATDTRHKKGVAMPAPSMPDHPMEQAMQLVLDLLCQRLKRELPSFKSNQIINDAQKDIGGLIPVIRDIHMREIGNIYAMFLYFDCEERKNNRRTVELAGKGISEQARRNLAKLQQGKP